LAIETSRETRTRRGGILLCAVGAVAVVWVLVKIARSGGGQASTPTVPPYVTSGLPPFAWPRPAEAGTDVWTPDAAYQPWPPEWITS
jgi:hypothetical protein